jgi:hypothetical protein
VRTRGPYWIIRRLLFVFGVVMPYRVLRLRLIRGSVTIEVDPIPSESKRLAPPNTGEEIERDKSALLAIGRCNDCFNLIRVIWHHVGIVGLVRQFRIVAVRLPRILEWLHSEQKVFVQ